MYQGMPPKKKPNKNLAKKKKRGESVTVKYKSKINESSNYTIRSCVGYSNQL